VAHLQFLGLHLLVAVVAVQTHQMRLEQTVAQAVAA
jgi:hypothetical protein